MSENSVIENIQSTENEEKILLAPVVRKTKKPLWLRILKWVGTGLGSLLMVLVAALLFLIYGPFTELRDVLVTTAMETSAARYICYALMPQDMIDEIMIANTVQSIDGITDTSQLDIPGEDVDNLDSLEIVDIVGPTYRGKMMIIRDPSRVSVACAPNLGPNGQGQSTDQIINNHGAIGGVNGGGFLDEGGVGNGGMPIGFVIQDGEVLFGGLNTPRELIGFDYDNHLVLGTMTGQQAIDSGIRDALSFGPFFIINGEAAEISGTGGGLNPRTVIGQRKDGTILLLVIDGRSINSLGASYADCIEVMQEYGAYNAANLDGGSSTVMVYEGEIINNCASLYGPRWTPTAVIVK